MTRRCLGMDFAFLGQERAFGRRRVDRSKLLLRAALGLALFSLPFRSAPSFAADQAHTLAVRLSWLTSGYQAAFYLAAAKGWYAKAGLDVLLTPGNGSVTTIQLVGSRQYDAGEAALSNMVFARVKGMAITSIAGFFRTGDVALMVPVESPIKGPADLKGKNIIYTAGSFEGPFLDSFLAAGGLTHDEVEFVSIEPNSRNSVYGSGGADGMFGSPVGSMIVLNKIRKSRPILFADYGLNLPGFGIVASLETLKEKGPAMRSFATAVSAAWAYIENGHEEEGVQAIVNARSNDRVDPDELRQQLHNSAPFLVSKATPGLPIGVQSEDDWKATIATMEKAKVIEPGRKAEDFFTNDYLDVNTIKALGSGS
jgi:NitT/TauT family transport system substrate-binding protein